MINPHEWKFELKKSYEKQLTLCIYNVLQDIMYRRFNLKTVCVCAYMQSPPLHT
jgi:hypothetical protein